MDCTNQWDIQCSSVAYRILVFKFDELNVYIKRGYFRSIYMKGDRT